MKIMKYTLPMSQQEIDLFREEWIETIGKYEQVQDPVSQNILLSDYKMETFGTLVARLKEYGRRVDDLFAEDMDKRGEVILVEGYIVRRNLVFKTVFRLENNLTVELTELNRVGPDHVRNLRQASETKMKAMKLRDKKLLKEAALQLLKVLDSSGISGKSKDYIKR